MMHESMYSGITEQLLFANTKYERMDMSFLVKISLGLWFEECKYNNGYSYCTESTENASDSW